MDLRAMTYFATHNGIEESLYSKAAETPYFLICDLLAVDSPLSPFAHSPRQIAEDAVRQSLGHNVGNALCEGDMIQAIERAHAELLRAFVGDKPLLSLLLAVPISGADGRQSILAATVGDIRLYCCAEGRSELIFCDPYCSAQAKGLHLSERKSCVRNLLGMSSHLHIHCQKFEVEPGKQYLALSYGAYSCWDEEQIASIGNNPLEKETGLKTRLSVLPPSEHQRIALHLFTSQFALPMDTHSTTEHPELAHLRKRTRLTSYTLTGAAASLLLLLGFHYFFDPTASLPPLDAATLANIERDMGDKHSRELRQLADNYDNQVHTLSLRLKEMQEQLASSEQKHHSYETVEAARLELVAQAHSLRQEKDDLVHQLEVLREERELWEKEVAKVKRSALPEEEVAKIQDEAAAAKTSLAALQEKESALVGENQRLVAKLETLQQLLETGQRTHTQLQQLAKANQALLSEMAALQQKEREKESQERQMQAQKERVLQDLKEQLKEQQEALATLRSTKLALHHELSSLKVEQTRLQEERSAAARSHTERRQLGQKRHLVVAGDTLSTISQQYYGTSKRWREIYDANQESISNPKQIKVGSELVIP